MRRENPAKNPHRQNGERKQARLMPSPPRVGARGEARRRPISRERGVQLESAGVLGSASTGPQVKPSGCCLPEKENSTW